VKEWNWKDHISLLLGVASATIVILRLLVVSAYRPETSLSILVSAGVANVILGTIISTVPFLIMTAEIYLVGLGLYSRIYSARWYPFAVLIGLAINVLMCPLVILITGYLVCGAVTSTVQTKAKLEAQIEEEKKQKNLERAKELEKSLLRGNSGTRVSLPLFGVMYFVTFLIWSPWWAVEKIEIAYNPTRVESRVAYVIDSNPTTLTILNEKTRKIEYFSAKTLSISRSICLTRDSKWYLSRPLISLLPPDPKYPKCPVVKN
jgi:hypothetical protein